jgi:thiamine-monophosphate kinase
MESEFIAWLRSTLPKLGSDVLVGPGDDAAVLAWRTMGDCVVTTDMLMDGVDFRLGVDEPERIGRKSLAVNLSDLAAMGSKPVGAVVSLALPRAGGLGLAKRLYAGLLPLAAEFECSIVGGDTNAYEGPLVISVTAFGRVGGQLGPSSPLLRNRAQPGDTIVVTGEFGGSILGKQFDFTPRVREALELAKQYGVRAAMDVSDGLSLDLSRMCAESHCGAVVRLDDVPIAAAAHQLAEQVPQSGTALEHALSDGEDFELILALPRLEAERAIREQPIAAGLTIIGEFIAEPGLWCVDSAGERTPLTPRGYEHRMT